MKNFYLISSLFLSFTHLLQASNVDYCALYSTSTNYAQVCHPKFDPTDNYSPCYILTSSCAYSGDLQNLRIEQLDINALKTNCSGRINLSNTNLQGAYLPGTNSENGINLTGANLSGTNLTQACLQYAVLDNINPGITNPGTVLSNANLSGASLKNANLDSAALNNTILTSADFTGAILTNLQDSQKSGKISEGLGIYSATLGSTKFNNANMAGISLSNNSSSNIKTGIDFTNTKSTIAGAILSSADLTNVNFTSIDLTGVNLVGATLNGTNFNSATLTNAVFTSPTTPAVLNNVNLSGATLTNVDFTGTTFNNVTFVPENTNGTIAAPSTSIAANINGVNFANTTFSNNKGLITLLASYSGPTILSLKGATLGAPNFNAGPSVTLDLTHWDFTNAKIGIFNPDEVSSLIIGGDYNNPADMRTIKFPFMQGIELDNVTVSNLNGDFSFSGAMVNNCWFGSNITNTNKGLAGGLSSKFTINHGSNSTYNNCSFYGILFNNSANPNNPALIGMQKTKFNGALNIKSCYFQTTDFTGITISPFSKSSINITDTRFVSWGASKNLAGNSFLNQLYAGVTKNTTNYSNINNYFHSGVQWYNINQSNGKDMTWNPYESGASSYDPTNATNSSGSIGL